MAEKIDITFKRASTIFSDKYKALAYLDSTTFKRGEPAIVVYKDTSDKKGDDSVSALFAIGVNNGVGKYHLCSSYQDFVNVTTALDIHIGNYNEFKQLFDDLFEYDSTNKRIKARKPLYVEGDIISDGEVVAIAGDTTPAGVTDYAQLQNKPAINGKELASGDNSLEALGIQPKGDYTTASQLATTLENYATKIFVSNNFATKAAVNTIQALIPATATADNQLADKDFVNSSIATATAEFKGSFTSLDDLKATSGNLNDYAFYLHKDSVGNSIVDRYKWTTAGWLYEYTLNNSSFTTEQWAALNSAITATLVNSYNSHLNNSTIHITTAERTKWNNKWDYDEEIIKAVKVNAAVLSDSATKLATARKIWGKYFDGSGNVSGDLTEVDNITASGKATIQGDIISGGEVVAIIGEGTPAGVTDYSALTGKPSINGVTLVSGNNTLASLGIQAAGDYATNSGVTTLLADYATKTFISNNYAGKAAFNSHIADTDIHITAAERAAWNAKWDYNEATIKAVKVTSASSADSVAWSGISGKPTTFTPSAHTHTASEISGLPTALSAFNNDVGYLTSITKSMVEGVLTGDITSHTHTFASLASKPTTIAGYGITDAYTSSTIDNKLSGYLPLSGGIMNDDAQIKFQSSTSYGSSRWAMAAYGPTFQIKFGGYGSSSTPYVVLELNNNGEMFNNGNLVIHSGNYNSYAPTLTGTGASGTWGINISGNAATATNADLLDNLDSTNFVRNINRTSTDINFVDANNVLPTSVKHDFRWTNTPFIDIASLLDLSYSLDWRSQIFVMHNSKTYIAIRSRYEGTTWGNWRELAFTDSNITGNAASATKLQTPRSIWGQPFDGTSDVNGNAHITGDLIVDGEVSALVA